LIEPLRSLEILQPVLTQILQSNTVQIEILDHACRRGREQDLAAVPGGTNPRGAVHSDPNVSVIVKMGLGGMKAYADADSNPVSESLALQRPLRRDCRGDSVTGPLEDDEELISSRVDLHATVVGEGVAEQTAIVCTHLAELLSQLDGETR
jgi:hypothetical protein